MGRKKEFAPGIPIDKKIRNLPSSTKRRLWRATLQKHITQQGKRKRVHVDLRLGEPRTTKAHSWAIPKAGLPKPGKTVLAVMQPTHTQEYMGFSGKIRSGYGKGTVKKEFDSPVEVIRSSRDKVLFNVYSKKHPEEFALIRTKGNNWILLNRTITRKTKKIRVPISKKVKPGFSNINPDKLDFVGAHKELILQPKVDGAFSSVVITPKEIRAFSYRTPKEKERIIEYTHKIPRLLDSKPPKGVKGITILQTEVVARKRKKVAGASDVAGILNSKVLKSREKQKALGNLEPWAFDVVKYQNKDVSTLPFEERRTLLKKIVGSIKSIKLMPAVRPGEGRSKLLQLIRKRKFPLTTEGVILIDPSTGKRMKSKFRPEVDVYIRKFFPGTGKYRTTAVGGFYYSYSKSGPIVGKVGTGFSDVVRRDMYKNPGKYLGAVAMLKADPQTKVGKPLTKASFIGLHPEKNILR
jgi:ATP-dependent DNA ligase